MRMRKDTLITNNNISKTIACIGLACALSIGAFGCSAGENKNEGHSQIEEEKNIESAIYPSVDELDLSFSKRDLDYSYDAEDAVMISLSDNGFDIEGDESSAINKGSTLTLSKAGTYILTGTLSDGEVIVDASDEDKLQVVFDGVNITNGDGPALLVENADKVFVTLAEGSENILSDGEDYELEGDDDKRDATLFSHDDLTINGTGTLIVNGNYEHGIVSKDDLVVCGATIEVTSKEDAMQGNDCVKSTGCSISINAGDDGIKSDQFVYFRDGNVNIESCYEGYEAVKIIIDGGEHHIIASDDAINAALPSDDASSTSSDVAGNERVFANANGFDGRDSDSIEDNEIHGNNRMMQEEDLQNNMDSGVESEREPGFDREQMIGKMEGKRAEQEFGDRGRMEDGIMGELPGDMPELPDGEQGKWKDAIPSDAEREKFDRDGGFGFGGANMAESSDADACLIQINGGTINVSGENDGLDSNGNIEINGGVILVCGPNNGMDGALDYDLDAKINGGTVLMTGSIASTRGLDDSEQGYAIVKAAGNKGSDVELIGAGGEVIASLVSTMSFDSVFVSASGISETAYMLEVDGTSYDMV